MSFADDLWLKAVEMVEGIEVVSGGEFFVHPVMVPKSQKVRLMKSNISGGGNDEQWGNLDRYFGLSGILADRLREE